MCVYRKRDQVGSNSIKFSTTNSLPTYLLLLSSKKSHTQPTFQFPAVFLFVATCSDVTSVDVSVVCPLRDDRAAV